MMLHLTSPQENTNENDEQTTSGAGGNAQKRGYSYTAG